MFDYGFANYRLYPVAERGTRVRGGLPVEGGSQESVAVQLDAGLTLLILKGSEQGIQLTPNLPESLAAPGPRWATASDRWTSSSMERRSPRSPSPPRRNVDATGLPYALRRILSRWPAIGG